MNSKTKDEFFEDLEVEKERIAKEERVRADEFKIKDIKNQRILKEIEDAKRESEIIKNSSLESSEKKAISIAKGLMDTFEDAQTQKIFISSEFNGIINNYRGNIITIYAHTGGGKSSLVANIIYSLIQETKRENQVKRILVLTNEEMEKDVFGRIACQMLGISYKNLKEFTPEMQKNIAKIAYNLSKTGVVTVIDDTWNGGKGATTTPEGIIDILDKVIQSEIQYDTIILDYFQGIFWSKDRRGSAPHEAQQRAIFEIDKYKEKLPCPIVILGQIRKVEGEDLGIYDHRHIGSKSLHMKTTDALEMMPNYDAHTTKFVVQKTRFGNGIGTVVEMGFDNGRFVAIDAAFIRRQNERRVNKASAVFDKHNGIKKEEKNE